MNIKLRFLQTDGNGHETKKGKVYTAQCTDASRDF